MANDNHSDQPGRSPDAVSNRMADASQPAPTITRTLVTGSFQDTVDGKQVWREYAYTVTIGDTEFIRRFEQTKGRK